MELQKEDRRNFLIGFWSSILAGLLVWWLEIKIRKEQQVLAEKEKISDDTDR